MQKGDIQEILRMKSGVVVIMDKYDVDSEAYESLREVHRSLQLFVARHLKNPILINNWQELKECTSDTHYLKIEDHSGWIYDKRDDEMCHYLSTHTFYRKTYQSSTEILQACGFNVVLANWDE